MNPGQAGPCELPPGELAQARERIARVQDLLARQGGVLRAPPPEPSTCCGRGCNGCVWEGFYEALGRWVEDADALLAG